MGCVCWKYDGHHTQTDMLCNNIQLEAEAGEQFHMEVRCKLKVGCGLEARDWYDREGRSMMLARYGYYFRHVEESKGAHTSAYVP